VAPRFWPRGVADALVSITTGVAFAVAFMLAPSAAMYGLLRLLGMPARVCSSGAAVFCLVVAVVLALPTVLRLEIGPCGLRFVRIAGSPRRLSWSEISDIAPAGRREILLRAWLTWPPLEATSCLSSLGHYRIQFTGGVAYFPPRDAAEFEALLREHGGGIAEQADAADEARYP